MAGRGRFGLVVIRGSCLSSCLNFRPVGWSTDAGIAAMFAVAGMFCKDANAPVPFHREGADRGPNAANAETGCGYGADACARPAQRVVTIEEPREKHD